MNIKESNAIQELTEMNDELAEENAALKEAVLELQGIIIAYQRKHIAELQDNDEFYCCQELH